MSDVKSQTSNVKDKRLGLCHRCEWRARHRETGSAHRFECGMDWAVNSCYAYRPVRPLVVRPNDGDERAFGAGDMLAPRSHAVGIAEGDYRIVSAEGGFVTFFEPKGEPF